MSPQNPTTCTRPPKPQALNLLQQLGPSSEAVLHAHATDDHQVRCRVSPRDIRECRNEAREALAALDATHGADQERLGRDR
ncbi:MAG TPA: hypothetical protein VM536_01160, partial [Chloroflexia bacterium]|nr:hypothetical protein [Chloroflexia bacterium]